MARFEGVKWADLQVRFDLQTRTCTYAGSDDKVFGVSRSVHYGLFLCFEGIRFFVRRQGGGRLEVVLVNWFKNLERLQRGVAFGLGREQQALVPSVEELECLFTRDFFAQPGMRSLLEEMAETGAQGYLRPFTVDEALGIGVTFPAKPGIRAVACLYERYLGEPFTGVVVPRHVRAVAGNGTGCLKLGGNYVMSVKAVDAAKDVAADAAAALFLDDNVHGNLMDRCVTEWDSSCALFAFTDNTVVKIPESPLILPSVTILGMTTLLREAGVEVQERHLTYGELVERTRKGELVAVGSVGTAGILNRADRLVLVDNDNQVLADHRPDKAHRLWNQLAETRSRYWDVYRGTVPAPEGMRVHTYTV